MATAACRAVLREIMSKELAVINEGMVLAQYGPMRLTIQAWNDDGPSTELAARAGEFSFSLLPRLLGAREAFRRDLHAFESIKADFSEPMMNKMVEAAISTGLPELGPMAAVAGTVAETVNLFLMESGAVKSIVENGGDLSIFLKPGQTANVGVRLGVGDPLPSYKIELRGDVRPLWGVASSGLGGRSLSQGIAEAALCVAASSPMADAAATAIANQCNIESPAVKRVLAESIDQDTDIRGLMVTESVGDLSEEETKEALARAIAYAEGLVGKGLILGSIVSLRRKTVQTQRFDDLVAALKQIKQ